MSLRDAESIRKHIFGGKTYLYAIPGYHRYSKEYNEKVGHLSTGTKEGDINAMNEYVNIGGSIVDILRLFENGADIKFQDPRDLVEIYEVIVAHVNNWVHYVNTDPNVKDAPLKSLQLMTEFAECIRDRVVGYKPKVEDIPELNRVKALFGSVGGIEAIFSDTNVGEEVSSPSPMVDRIADMLNKRKQGKF